MDEVEPVAWLFESRDGMFLVWEKYDTCLSRGTYTPLYATRPELIAAAPDLLEALKGLLEVTDDPDNDADPEESVFTFARQVIAKAEGHSNG